MKKKIAISFGLGIIISLLSLYFALHNVPLGDLWAYLKTIDYFWVLPSSGAVLLGFGLRTLRWQMILAASRKVEFWAAFHPLMIGFAINCILPGRVGEIARPAILSQKKEIAFTTGLATVAAERVLDIFILIVLFALVLVRVQPDPNFTMRFGELELSQAVLERIAANTLKLCVLLLCGIVLISIERTRKMSYNIIDWIPKRFTFLGPKIYAVTVKLSQTLKKIIGNFAMGFALIKRPQMLIFCLIISIIIWWVNALSYYFFTLGCEGIELSFIEVFAMMVIICFFVALPSVPGYWGIWEAGGVFALSLFGVGEDEAAGYTLTSHAIQILPVIMVGLISAWITSVDIFKVSYQQSFKYNTVDKASSSSERGE
jgi:uncharacterized protein (TIRG00374 family)